MLLGILIMAVQLFLGVSLLWGCFTGLFSQEGKYDRENTIWMNTSYVIGMLLGALMLANLFGLTDVPVVPFI